MKKQLLLLIMMLLPIVVNASYDINGINYDLDFESKTAEVTKKISRYSGDIVIPSLVKCYDVEFNVTSIGEDAFYQCGNLTSITIPCSIKYIKKNAFNFCLNLTSVTIPNNVAIIGEFAFANCTALTSIKIGSSVTNIGNYAFAYCKNLTDVYCYAEKKPESSSSIFDNTNINNGVLYVPESSIEIYKSHEVWGQFGTIQAITDKSGKCGENLTWTYSEETKALTISGSGAMQDYNVPKDIPWHEYKSKIERVVIDDGVTTICSYAFSGCTNLVNASIGNSLLSISEAAFAECTTLKTITIPTSVNSIEKYAFLCCTNLSSVVFNGGLTKIGENAFQECKALTTISLPNSVTTIESGAFNSCSGLISIDIPNGVTSIGGNAFGQCHSLTTVTIPNSVTSFGAMVFNYCTNLESVTLSDKITSIGDATFNHCSKLQSITIPNSVTLIEDYAFRESGLTSIVIPSSVTAVHMSVFADCQALATVSLPNSLSEIGHSMFNGCISLTDIIIPNSIETIGDAAFGGCSNLTSISIPSSVTKIDEYAFFSCNNLASVIIGSGIKSINRNAFANCTTLIDVYCYANDVPSTNSTVFNNSNPANITLHVPAASVGAYEAQTPWSSFKEVVSLPYIIYMVDGEVYKQDLVMIGTPIPPIEEPKKEGHTFSGWSEIPEIMPDHDITVTGSFTINKYKLTYQVDGEEYKTYEVVYGSEITPEPMPTKEGYTFSGWSWIPSKMPAEDVTVTGTFTINKYKLTYMVNGENYKSYDVEYGQSITPEGEPTKEGYTFSGWSWIPSKMPAEDVAVTGTFTANHYKLIYMVDGAVYKSIDVACDDPITPEAEPTKEGYTFSGWSYIPKKMPAEDVTVTGTFSINSYKLTYMIDNEVYKETMYEYDATITPEPQPEGDYQTFEWTDLPQTMPAHDVTVYATYTSGIAEIVMMQGVLRIYSPDGKPRTELQKGLNIVRMSDGTTKKIVVK